jgi:hypothetical protein
MKEVTLSTGQVAQIRTKDELTEGQSRKIEIARSRGSAVFQRLGVQSDTGFTIPPSEMDKLSDDDFTNIRGFEDAAISVMTVSLDGESIGEPTDLTAKVYEALSDAVLGEYSGVQVTSEGPDDKINPLAEAAESTPSSLGESLT